MKTPEKYFPAEICTLKLIAHHKNEKYNISVSTHNKYKVVSNIYDNIFFLVGLKKITLHVLIGL